MNLKAILFNFNGVIINDDFIHQQLLDELLLAENLSPSGSQYKQYYQGNSDRIGLKNIFSIRGRVLDNHYLDNLLNKKAIAYQSKMEQMGTLPIIEQVVEFILQTQTYHLPLAIVTGAVIEEVEYVLQKANLRQYFSVIIGGDDVEEYKPSPEGYLLAIDKLNQLHPGLFLQPSQCLAIENTSMGISAAKNAGIQVVGVANSYPLHMLQRQSNWCVDHLLELDLERIGKSLVPV